MQSISNRESSDRMTGVTDELESAPSIYSYSSSRDGVNLLRTYEGRTLNAQNELYVLPADESEHDRLDKQHLCHVLSVGGLYVCEDMVNEVMTTPGPKSILDLGTGSGAWAAAVAEVFPEAEVVGTDLAPSRTRPPPANCRYEFDDFSLGLQHYYASFDFVHARTVASGVSNFQDFVNEAAMCVKPGGILIIVDGNFELLTHELKPQDPAFGDGAPDQSWLARVCFETYNIQKARGSAVDAGLLLSRHLDECPLITNIGYKEVLIPIGPWEWFQDSAERVKREQLGMLMRQDMKEFVKSLRPMFISEGFPNEVVDRFINGTAEELDALRFKMYIKYHHGWARRLPELADDNDDGGDEDEDDGSLMVHDEEERIRYSRDTSTSSISLPTPIGSPAGPLPPTPPATADSSAIEQDDTGKQRSRLYWVSADGVRRTFIPPGPNATPVIFRDPEEIPDDSRTLSDVVSMSISTRSSRRLGS